jgi:hypothetical protein
MFRGNGLADFGRWGGINQHLPLFVGYSQILSGNGDRSNNVGHQLCFQKVRPARRFSCKEGTKRDNHQYKGKG